ncbi:MAG: MFS transporter [Candidatus Hodarchaeota archaeon]
MRLLSTVERINAIQFLTGVGIMAGFTYIPLFLRDFKATNEEVAFVAAGFAVLLFFSSIIAGRIADLTSRTRVVIVGLVSTALTFFFVSLSNSITSLALFRILSGLTIGIYPAALAALSFETRKGFLGKFSSFNSLGWACGALFGGIVAEFTSYSTTFFLSGLLFVTALILAFTIPDTTLLKKVESESQPFLPLSVFKTNALVYLTLLLRHGTASAVWVFWPLFLEEIGASDSIIGVIQALNFLTQFFIMFLLTDRGDPKTLILIGFGLSGLTFMLMITFPELLIVGIAQLILGIGWSALYVGVLRRSVENATERATAAGGLGATLSISGLAGPIIASFLALWIEEPFMLTMWVAMAASFLAGFIYLVWNKDSSNVSNVFIANSV